MRVNVAMGAGLTVVLVFAAFAAPTVLRGLVDTLSSLWLLLGLVVPALIIGGVRRLVIGPASKQIVPGTGLVAAYVLAALPLGIAALALGAVVTTALVFQWEARFDLVQSFLLLLFGFVVFSITVKIVVNAKMLARHWLRPFHPKLPLDFREGLLA